MAVCEKEYFGSDAQTSVLKRGHALFEVLKGDGRFSSHGRTVGLVSPLYGSVDLLTQLARLQGATHYACVSPKNIQSVLAEIAQAKLHATHYARWEITADAFTAVRKLSKEIALPDGLVIQRMRPDTAPEIVESFAQMSLVCGVLPAWRSAHMGKALRACTLLAVTTTGQVVASAYASSYMTDSSELAKQECFWGMLATDPDWRGRRLSLALGSKLLLLMNKEYGFTSFYTGVEPGNIASETVCHRLGLRTKGNSIVTVADAGQLPGGRMTK